MPASPLALPGLAVYPERETGIEGWADRIGVGVEGLVRARAPRLRARLMRGIVGRVGAHADALASASDAALRDEARLLRARLARDGFAEANVALGFALVREAARRTVGQRHFDVQIIGGYALLKGCLAEMETGEGKTLAATLPAAVAALAGVPVHVITVNDYLARRDAEAMGPIYRALGLSVGVIVHGAEPADRRAAYRADVTYGTNKEIAFDYLRDRLLLGGESRNLSLKLERLQGGEGRTAGLLLRGLHFAIVDEADSVLIDEARTPLILTEQGASPIERETAEQALDLAGRLVPDADFRIYLDERRVALTRRGRDRLAEDAAPLGGVWQGTVLREDLAAQALSACHLFRRDEHYLVRDGKVQIVDEYTGRILADRYWSDGLHQMIEVKEGCALSGQRVTRGRITYQRFFRRYRHLCGMTGTAREVRGEMWSVYRLPVVTIPTNRPVRRRRSRARAFASAPEKWEAVARRVAEVQGSGRPVLLGTRSIAASEEASRSLDALGIAYRTLSAAQDENEAEIVTAAGEPGRVTIATNMAGRGTDIVLSPGIAALGGLHVIISEIHDSGRIDRQLAGRCARQGDPGSVDVMVSLEDPLLGPVRAAAWARLLLLLAGRSGGRSARMLFRLAQRHAEWTHSRIRRELMRADQRLGHYLAFSGRLE